MRTLAIPKYLRLPLLLGIPILAVLVLWRVQQNNVNSLAQQIDALQQKIDAMPPTVTLEDKLALEKDRLTLEKDRVNAQNAIYGTLVQALGGAFFVVTAYFTYRNVRATEANVRAAEEKQVTERFSKAIELLGSEKLEVRLGGIYALERIAKDSREKDYWTIMEVLTGFVRERSNSRWEKKERQTSPQARNQTTSTEAEGKKRSPPPTDIQAVLTVLKRRTPFYKERKEEILDLSGSDFSWMDLYRVSFQGINLSRVNFQNAFLVEANFSGCQLEAADFTKAVLSRADFTKADLFCADLIKAELRGADLTGADLNLANLTEADLTEADLSGATNLFHEQIREAKTDKNTKFPNGLRSQIAAQPESSNPHSNDL
jgi:hypothetical protein